jgi:hypothetical protein
MTAHAVSTARAPQTSKTTSVPHVRPVYDEVEYDSEAETLVGSEPDDDGDAHPASANNQPAAGHEGAGRLPTNEPCAPQSNIDAVVRAQKAKEMEDAVQWSLSLIAGARPKHDKGDSCKEGTMAPGQSKH